MVLPSTHVYSSSYNLRFPSRSFLFVFLTPFYSSYIYLPLSFIPFLLVFFYSVPPSTPVYSSSFHPFFVLPLQWFHSAVLFSFFFFPYLFLLILSFHFQYSEDPVRDLFSCLTFSAPLSLTFIVVLQEGDSGAHAGVDRTSTSSTQAARMTVVEAVAERMTACRK